MRTIFDTEGVWGHSLALFPGASVPPALVETDDAGPHSVRPNR